MWSDEDSDGCIYDTVDCDHTCDGCEYGRNFFLIVEDEANEISDDVWNIL